MAASTLTAIESLSAALFPQRKTYVSLREAALQTSLSEKTLRRYANEGRLATQKVGRRVLVSQASLDSLLQS